MNTLTLSIVIPAYNEESHIKACLDSIAAQSERPDEVIVVDNNSTDKTAEIAQKYPFVRLLKASKQGIVYARNVGFDAARCDIIARIDADTILQPSWVQRVKAFYHQQGHERYALTGGGYFYNLHMQRLYGWVQSQFVFRLNRFIVGHYILWGSNMAFLRHQWQAVRSDVCLRDDIHEDLDLSFHLHAKGYRIRFEAKPMRVGVYLKRYWNGRNELRAHMRRWPVTLRLHGYRRWWIGVVGNLFLWFVVQPLAFMAEGISRLLDLKLPTK